MDNEHEFNKQYEGDIEVTHAFSHNVFVKLHKVPKAGTPYKGHYHNTDHTTLVSSGKVSVEFGAVPEVGLEAETHEYIAPAMFITRAFRRHKITALEDNTVFCCIHATVGNDGKTFPSITQTSYEDTNHMEFIPKTESPYMENVAKGMDGMTMGYPIDPIKYNKLLERASEEGTLEPGSHNNLT